MPHLTLVYYDVHPDGSSAEMYRRKIRVSWRRWFQELWPIR